MIKKNAKTAAAKKVVKKGPAAKQAPARKGPVGKKVPVKKAAPANKKAAMAAKRAAAKQAPARKAAAKKATVAKVAKKVQKQLEEQAARVVINFVACVTGENVKVTETAYIVDGRQILRTQVVAVVGKTVYYRTAVDCGALVELQIIKGKECIKTDENNVVVYDSAAISMVSAPAAEESEEDEDDEGDDDEDGDEDEEGDDEEGDDEDGDDEDSFDF
jgi:hypothetical protein